MRRRASAIVALAALAFAVSGCSVAGIKPLSGDKSATAALASFAPQAPTPAGHMPKAASIPAAPVVLGYAEGSRSMVNALVSHYASAYKVPERLVHRVIQRESRYNTGARNGPYYGLMQISHATARGMGYGGSASGLLDPDTNLRYAVRYLAGAYVTARGNEDRAVGFYARGYYYDAKRLGLLEESGLR